ncbi:hypothetical protein WJX73_010937 [Symbiochloris irregularis]|uniref:Septin-type G domain-containing protein n=1 Tax=Symbiochloris irregularis TaxID=706552 RepID=A0AAW1P030_9CHLO
MPHEHRFLHVNALVVGESGLGKTTFTMNLHQDFQGPDFKLWPHDGAETSMASFKADPDSLCMHLPKAVATESGDWVMWHMQDTPGHGNIDDTEHMNMIINHIRSKKYLQYEMERQLLQGMEPQGNRLCEARDDHLYDVAFYFIPPHRFKPADLEYIRRLSQEVTVVLVCAKADCMTMDERRDFQMGIRDRMINSMLHDLMLNRPCHDLWRCLLACAAAMMFSHLCHACVN